MAFSSSHRAKAWWIGFAVIFCASLTFLVAIPYGVINATDVSVSARTALGRAPPGIPKTRKTWPEKLSDQELADAYAPILEFSGHEKWALVDAKAYVADAALFALRGKRSFDFDRARPARLHPTLDSLPTDCSRTPWGLCFTLSCREGDGACRAPKLHGPGPSREGVDTHA